MKNKKQYKLIFDRLSGIPTVWDGYEAILEMKNNNFRHWRQMEWIGFYFQFLCEKYLSDIFQFNQVKYGKVTFDGFYQIPFDFKSHAINTSAHQIIVNDRDAILEAIKDYGKIGLLLSLGEVLYNDEQRTFQQWHESLKGGSSKYTLERIQRGAWSRLRKVRFYLRQIILIEIKTKTLYSSGLFQENFRNANGKPRRKKVLIDLEKINTDIAYRQDFGS